MCLLMFHPSAEALAERTHDACNQLTPDGERCVELCRGVQWNSFKDRFPNIFIQNVRDIHDVDVIFLANFDSPETIFEQLSLIYSLPRYLVRSFVLIVPYFPTGTMERVDVEGQIVTAKVLASMLSIIPLSSLGPTQLVIFDIHNLTERFYFTDNVIPRLESGIPTLLRRLEKLPDHKDVSIAFPDEGAFKRFHKIFEDANYETIICTKVRDGDKRIVKVKEGNVTGRHVVIVDDLVQTGGTLFECARALMAANPSKISIYVTHAVFPNESWKRFTDPNPADRDIHFEHFWITDSVPRTVAAIGDRKPFELLSLADHLGHMFQHYDLRRMSPTIRRPSAPKF